MLHAEELRRKKWLQVKSMCSFYNLERTTILFKQNKIQLIKSINHNENIKKVYMEPYPGI